MSTCPNCGKENPDTTRFCGFCGKPLASSADAPAAVILPTPAVRIYNKHNDAYSIASLITGIVANIFAFTDAAIIADFSSSLPKLSDAIDKSAFLGFIFLILFDPFAIAAVVFGILGLKRIEKSDNKLAGKGMSIAGICLGGLIIVILFLITINNG